MCAELVISNLGSLCLAAEQIPDVITINLSAETEVCFLFKTRPTKLLPTNWLDGIKF